MFKIIFIAIFLRSIISFADAEPMWRFAQSHPAGSLSISKVMPISKPEEQISCNHLHFRYHELDKILNDIDWLSALKDYNKMDAYEYIRNRLQADPNAVAGRFAYKIEFDLIENLLTSTEPVEALGVLGSTNFELLFPENNYGQNATVEVLEKKLHLTTQINAYDICGKTYLDIFLLRNCPKNNTEIFNCGDTKCPASLTYDWQSCKDIQVYRVSLKQLKNKLGFRKREIRWRPK